MAVISKISGISIHFVFGIILFFILGQSMHGSFFSCHQAITIWSHSNSLPYGRSMLLGTNFFLVFSQCIRIAEAAFSSWVKCSFNRSEWSVHFGYHEESNTSILLEFRYDGQNRSLKCLAHPEDLFLALLVERNPAIITFFILQRNCVPREKLLPSISRSVVS